MTVNIPLGKAKETLSFYIGIYVISWYSFIFFPFLVCMCVCLHAWMSVWVCRCCWPLFCFRTKLYHGLVASSNPFHYWSTIDIMALGLQVITVIPSIVRFINFIYKCCNYPWFQDGWQHEYSIIYCVQHSFHNIMTVTVIILRIEAFAEGNILIT